ncbi:MAG: hypothetical protein KBT31_04950, partial [Firmicutes bacterium]|nr:hypothetical protein [Candidatus Colimorpha enterica]
MNILVRKFSEESEYRNLVNELSIQRERAIPRPSRMTGISDGLRPLLIAALSNDVKRSSPLLVVVKDEKEMLKMHNNLAELGVSSIPYRYRDFVFHDVTASRESEQERIAALSAILSNSCDAVITTPDACVQYTVPSEKLLSSRVEIRADEPLDLDSLVSTLIGGGYVRTDMVDAVGQFSVRGGIIDIFPAGYEYPVRIELFGDDIDSMSFFDIITQRRTDTVDDVFILPAKEIINDDRSRKEIAAQLTKLIAKAKDGDRSDNLRHELASVTGGGEMLFADRFISVIYPEKECLLDYCKNCNLIMFDTTACFDRIKSYDFHLIETVKELIDNGLIMPSAADYGKSGNSFLTFADSTPGVFADTFMSSISDMKFSALYSVVSRQTVSYTDRFDLIVEDLISYGRGGYTCLIMCENEIIEKKLSAFLEEKGIAAVPVVLDGGNIKEGAVNITFGTFLPGFELPSLHFSALSTCSVSDGYSRKTTIQRKKRAERKSAEEKILSYADLSVGDFIVHEKYGIGIYEGIESKMIDGVKSDFVKLRYLGTDRLFIPCHQLDSISKYIGPGVDDGSVKLSKIGGPEWGRTKDRVKKAAREMAEE